MKHETLLSVEGGVFIISDEKWEQSMDEFNWTCPHCERAVTISGSRYSESRHTLNIENADGRRSFISKYIVCPNSECAKFTLMASLWASSRQGAYESLHEKLEEWSLMPTSKAKTFPDYIPQPIRDDYKEACLICDISPKASATLSRRCLQGILRDFWGVKPARLVDEIEQVEDKIDPLTWKAIDAVRKLGNIGAHMEKDINLIVDVDPDEAELLIGLIETLFREWYISREERKKRMGALIDITTKKAQ